MTGSKMSSDEKSTVLLSIMFQWLITFIVKIVSLISVLNMSTFSFEL